VILFNILEVNLLTKKFQVEKALKEEGKIAAVKKHRELYKLSLNETVQIINKMN
jgi:ribosomal protein L7/L12